jgi:pyruvate/2-oxoglutarate dehydrogenase complex dihydrolipoamide acyltransferase (E2) component
MPEDRPSAIPYPPSRRLTFDVGRIGRAKHHVQALLEVDVTEARRRLRQGRRSGANISFTAWLIKTVADCVARHPVVAGFNDPGRNRVLAFADVDVAIVVEKPVEGARVPLPLVIRGANRKAAEAIGAEIEAAKSQAVVDERGWVLGAARGTAGLRWFVRLPQWLRLALTRALLLRDPRRARDAMGTVMLTSVGMAGHTRGWIVPFGMHPLCLAVGSVNVQPAVREGRVEPREILHLTALVDHDVVDGMPAARFVGDLVERLEAAAGLPS